MTGEVKLHRPIFGSISSDLFSVMYMTMLATIAWVIYSLIESWNSNQDYQQSQNLVNQA